VMCGRRSRVQLPALPVVLIRQGSAPRPRQALYDKYVSPAGLAVDAMVVRCWFGESAVVSAMGVSAAPHEAGCDR
jgi:hypothetical protein